MTSNIAAHAWSIKYTLGVEYYSTPQVKTEHKKYWAILNNVEILKNTETQVLNNTEFCSVQ